MVTLLGSSSPITVGQKLHKFVDIIFCPESSFLTIPQRLRPPCISFGLLSPFSFPRKLWSKTRSPHSSYNFETCFWSPTSISSLLCPWHFPLHFLPHWGDSRPESSSCLKKLSEHWDILNILNWEIQGLYVSKWGFLELKKNPVVIKTGKTHFASENKSQKNVNIVCLCLRFIVSRCFMAIRMLRSFF